MAEPIPGGLLLSLRNLVDGAVSRKFATLALKQVKRAGRSLILGPKKTGLRVRLCGRYCHTWLIFPPLPSQASAVFSVAVGGRRREVEPGKALIKVASLYACLVDHSNRQPTLE